MPRFLRILLWAVAGLILISGGLVAYAIQDPNRYKPQLEQLILDQTGIPVEVDGDLGWELWPLMSLSAEDVSTTYQGQHWTIGRLAANLDVLSLLQDPQQWRVQAVTLERIRMSDAAGVLDILELQISDLAPRQPAPISTRLTYTPAGQPPIPLDLAGFLSVDPDTQGLALADARFTTDAADGTCDLAAGPVATPAAAPRASAEDLLPLEVFRSYDWNGTCLLDELRLEGQTFHRVAVKMRNRAGDSDITLEAPELFEGRATLDVAIDAHQTPVRWTVAPQLTAVNSQQLLAWLDQRLQWLAPLAYGGTLTFEGNSTDALIASMSGATRFDAGQGVIDIAKIRSQLLSLAEMFNEGERIRNWPENWQYQKFVGDWRIDRQHHLLSFVLDNLNVTAEGDYRPESGEIDVLAELVFRNDPSLPVFDLNPLLYDLPIPIHCRGPLTDPSCRLDPDAAQRILASALTSGEDTALRSKLNQKIDEEVPEQYRDAARSLLESLGGALSRQPR